MRQETRDKRQGHFLQSTEWEEFQRSLACHAKSKGRSGGREVFRIDDVLVIKLPLIFGKSYFYIGGVLNFQFSIFSPSGDLPQGDNFQSIFNSSNFQTLAKQHNAIFLKVEPMLEDTDFAQELLKSGFKKSSKQVQPQGTVVLDITKSEEELLLGMHAKTRYNIRVAERNSGIEYRVWGMGDYGFDAALESFWQLMRKTTQRDSFSSHPRIYYEKLLRSFSSPHTLYPIPYTSLFTVEYQNKIVAANIVLFYGDTAYYLHGASDYEYRATMAPYLLHWETIKYAKELGCKAYDLWGIDEKKWPGVTRFKKGFGGREVEYVGSYDYVFKGAWYKLYKLRQFIR